MGRSAPLPPRAPSTPRRQLADLNRRRMYGLVGPAFDSLVLEALGRCMLCERVDQNDFASGLVIDHDHATGRVRGLICGICNRALHFVEEHGYGDDWHWRARAYMRMDEDKDALWLLFDAINDKLSQLAGWIAHGDEVRANIRVHQLRKLIAKVRDKSGIPAEDFYAYLFSEGTGPVAKIVPRPRAQWR